MTLHPTYSSVYDTFTHPGMLSPVLTAQLVALLVHAILIFMKAFTQRISYVIFTKLLRLVGVSLQLSPVYVKN